MRRLARNLFQGETESERRSFKAHQKGSEVNTPEPFGRSISTKS
ncbi:hypothetical protein NIES2104_57310 [Leptolyngbya sp. NIES-2104]|nr:hypothetical protein NIES2104_57310 [Leptolyngbya sp. NIES-2104]